MKQSQVDEHGCDDERCLPLKQTVIGFLAVDTDVHRLDKKKDESTVVMGSVYYFSKQAIEQQANKKIHTHTCTHARTHAFVNKATNGQRDIKHEKGKQNLAECHC